MTIRSVFTRPYHVMFEVKRGSLPPAIRRRLPKGSTYYIVRVDADEGTS